jgi:L-ascorbate metabolism protein UlaG (beta-lactamase superfamily)
VRSGGASSRDIWRIVTGNSDGVGPPRREQHVLSRSEAVDPLRSTDDRVTWLGHAGFAIRLAGIDLIIDPFLDDFASPVWGIGPRRIDPSPLRATDVAHPHVVLLSHNHYDHLDRRTLFAIPGRTSARAIVPEGLGPYVREIGFAHVTELPWGARVDIGPVTVTSVPAVHFSGRGLFDRNRSHWNGYLLDSGRRRVYFAGDTAYSPRLGAAASVDGPCDLALVPIGAYMPAEMMAAVHATPEEAVQIGRDARASRILAMHWGTITLSTEPTFEPPSRFIAAALRDGYRG